MRIVTFYSFKGGVGRTMALMNTAATLAERGRRVLLVDFDLEAPGLQSYPLFNESKSQIGIVDYVSSYLATGNAPNAKDYLSQYKLGETAVWLMSAGVQDSSYAARLNSIEWLKLYNERDGYLMFEDLKQQWAKLKFDYVLIDSRTGHTDVAGICTRQLPDAVALMFLPNDQNVSGLADVVRDIRAEAEEPREKQIFLHFCPSNVPDLDDEDLILQRHLDDAMKRLNCDAFASVIHHYNNLALLDQTIFVHSRPRTRLSEEYRCLTDAIVGENLEDRDGALSRLEKIRTSLRKNRDDQDLGSVESTLGEIYQHHRNNGEIAWSLSLVYEMLSNVIAQREMLDIAIEHKFNELRARTKRAQILLRDRNSEMGRDDLRHVLLSRDTTMADLIASIERLREIDPDWVSIVQKSEAIKKLKASDLDRIVHSLSTSTAGATFAAELLEKHATSGWQLAIALIGSGKFRRAKELLGGHETILQSDSIVDVFNFGCADWGDSGVAPIDIFERVLVLKGDDTAYDDANYIQCLSMASYVTGRAIEAQHYLKRAGSELKRTAPGLVLSCWRFLNVARSEFSSDLNEMEVGMRSGHFVPRFIQQPSFLQ